MTEYATLSLATPQPGLLVVTLNRPERANALNTRMGRDLEALWSGLIASPGDTRCVILTRLCPRGELMATALETAAAICANAPLSIRQAKKAIHHGLQMDLKNGFLFEIEAYNRLVGTEDRSEGIRAFNEKRKPVFKGR